MTIDELIERLKALPKDVRRRPLMDGKPAVGYRLAPLKSYLRGEGPRG